MSLIKLLIFSTAITQQLRTQIKQMSQCGTWPDVETSCSFHVTPIHTNKLPKHLHAFKCMCFVYKVLITLKTQKLTDFPPVFHFMHRGVTIVCHLPSQFGFIEDDLNKMHHSFPLT